MTIHGYFFSSDLVKFQKGLPASLYFNSTQFNTFKVEIDAGMIEIKEDRLKYIVIQKRVPYSKP
jgi:hypothetical protein